MLFHVPIEGQLAIATIILALLYAIVRWVQSFRALTAEGHTLQNLQFTSIPSTYESASTQIASLPEDSPLRSFFGDAIRSGTLDDEALPYLSWIHWPRYLAGMFVFLGLLGTVWGIAHAVTSLGQSVQSSTLATSVENMQALEQGIYRLLSGISYASMCTLIGLVATILVSALNSVYAKKATSLTELAGSLAKKRYLPLFSSDSSARTYDEALPRLESAINALKSISESLEAKIKPAAEYLVGIQRSTNQVVEQFNNSYSEFREELKQVKGVYAQVSQELSKSPAESLASLRNLVDEFLAIAGRFDTEREIVSQSTGNMSDSAVRMERAVRELRETIVESDGKQSAKFDEFVSDIKATRSSLDAILRRFERVLLDITLIPENTGLRSEIAILADEIGQFGGVMVTAATTQNKTIAQHAKLSEDIRSLQALFVNWEKSAQTLLSQISKQSTFPSRTSFVAELSAVNRDVNIEVARPSDRNGSRGAHTEERSSFFDKLKFWERQR